MKIQFHKLQIRKVDKPIKGATTVTFEVPIELRNVFNFRPGQHLIIKFKINGEETRRCYSLNSCPYIGEPLQITVKRVKGGLVSNFVNDNLTAGTALEVMPPHGNFFAEINPANYKSYFLFAAGSGITPIFSILKSVLTQEPNSIINFIYGNRNKSNIIYFDELEELREKYNNRLKIIYTLSGPYSDWSSMWGWKGRKGRIDEDAVEWFIENHPPIAQKTEYFICGPNGMNLTVQKTLLELGVPKDLIHIEHFGGGTKEVEKEIPNVKAALSAKLNGQVFETIIPKGKSILQALKSTGAQPPYSCESGVCGTCVAKVVKGEISMKSCMALDGTDQEKGLILTCQALPLTKEIMIEY